MASLFNNDFQHDLNPVEHVLYEVIHLTGDKDWGVMIANQQEFAEVSYLDYNFNTIRYREETHDFRFSYRGVDIVFGNLVQGDQTYFLFTTRLSRYLCYMRVDMDDLVAYISELGKILRHEY